MCPLRMTFPTPAGFHGGEIGVVGVIVDAHVAVHLEECFKTDVIAEWECAKKEGAEHSRTPP